MDLTTNEITLLAVLAMGALIPFFIVIREVLAGPKQG